MFAAPPRLDIAIDPEAEDNILSSYAMKFLENFPAVFQVADMMDQAHTENRIDAIAG